MLKHLFLISLFITSIGATAQTITLEFPYFAGQTYEFKIVQGNKHVVLQEDTIPKDGKVQLQILEKYKGYKGMAMWYLTNSKTGGGLELVINNEDFSVTCLQAVPTTQGIIYKNTKENIFEKSAQKEQQAIFAKHDAMLAATRAYDKNTPLYGSFNKEYNRILKEYATYVKKLKNTNLYAARFIEIINLTKGLGTIISQDEVLKAKNINAIIVNNLEYKVLYTSNFWGAVINTWVQLQTNVLKNDAQFTADAKTILNRISSDKVYTEFVEQLTKELTKVGKDSIITALTPAIKNAKKLENYNGVLSVYQKDLTGKAPSLVVHLVGEEAATVAQQQQPKVIDLAQLNNKYSVLVFYQSGCGPCKELMAGLQDNYKNLTTKGIEIISMASDTDAQEFKTTATQHPWAKKYCDLQGFHGINFKNYAVIGTPTLFVVNNEGIIIHKMNGMKELLAWSAALKE
ncbi:peroxiredoxin family protein [Polaribacter glomeratus]|uniref:Thioredoxin domain-containing protein n=1 Tax=Polaribacter glomeratus TaxID=102 RepID=A0A2S7WWE5_9FLAO|nr:TlpA disulfide reductase family protein [Polaribacter glomeratus]PQJ81924.1 hypothetical protein BTO16_04765 [Polaribacter glomeratus]TXD64413.1 TlpA family protein disulfide reductase [Polaribacter glomeratus]